MKFPKLKKLKKEFAKKLVCKTIDYLAEHEDKGRWQPLKSDERFIQLTTDFLWNRIIEFMEQDYRIRRDDTHSK